MKRMSEEIDEFGMPKMLYEMANLRPNETGLPMVIWVQPKTGKEKHGPRIKVQSIHGSKVYLDKMISIGFDRNGNIENFGGLSKKDLDIVSKFIKKNVIYLLQLWDDEISPAEFSKKIKMV